MREENYWWQVPGPAAFFQEVWSALQNGNNVLLAFPAHAPDGLRDLVEYRVKQDPDGRVFEVLECIREVTEQALPSLTVYTELAPRVRPEGLENLVKLAKEPLLERRLIWVETSSNTWASWAMFIQEYAAACSTTEPSERPIFCVSGPCDCDPAGLPPGDTALEVISWHRRVSRLDILIFSDHLLRRSDGKLLERELRCEAIVELAGPDPELATWLAEADVPGILEPFECLKEFGKQRGWSTEALEVLGYRWHQGTEEHYDGMNFQHSAALAIDSRFDQLNRRLWRAQMRTLFLHVEERRLGLARQLRRHLHVPYIIDRDTINDIEELEISHIVAQLRGKKVPSSLLQELEGLRDIRNNLAHLKPATTIATMRLIQNTV